MLFSVIYSADCPRSESIARFRPPQTRKLWDMTESDEGYEYGYLEGDWEKGKHRKWCGLLTKEQFNRFVEATGLVADSDGDDGKSWRSRLWLRLVPRYFIQRRWVRAGDSLRLRHADPGDSQGAVRREGLATASTGRAESIWQQLNGSD